MALYLSRFSGVTEFAESLSSLSFSLPLSPLSQCVYMCIRIHIFTPQKVCIKAVWIFAYLNRKSFTGVSSVFEFQLSPGVVKLTTKSSHQTSPQAVINCQSSSGMLGCLSSSSRLLVGILNKVDLYKTLCRSPQLLWVHVPSSHRGTCKNKFALQWILKCLCHGNTQSL